MNFVHGRYHSVFRNMFKVNPFYTNVHYPLKSYETTGFLTFSVIMEMEHWRDMCSWQTHLNTNAKQSDCGSSAHPQLFDFYFFLKNCNLRLNMWLSVKKFIFTIILIPINPLRIRQYTKQIFKIASANNCITRVFKINPVSKSIIIETFLFKGNFKVTLMQI